MKQSILIILLFILALSCKDEITVMLQREPGSISGQILPEGVGATVSLYQGQLLQEKTTDDQGFFIFSGLTAGTYTLRASAPNFGTGTYSGVPVADGEGYDIGQFQLNEFPAPLLDVYPANGDIDIPLRTTRVIMLYFGEMMDINSLRNAFSITPAVYGLTIYSDTYRSPYASYHIYNVDGNFRLGTSYSFTIDSTATSLAGEPLEFAYSSSFRMEYFKLAQYNLPSILTSDHSIFLRFNSDVNSNDLQQYLRVEPDIPMYVDPRIDTYQSIRPALSWIPDTLFTITIDRQLPDVDGNTLQHDTSLVVISDKFKVEQTWPYHNQHFIRLDQDIQIRMNNLLDEGSIPQAVSVQPALSYEIETSNYGGFSSFILQPDSLSPDTWYTVTIDTDLHDYYGKPLEEDYSFSFKTE
jgi:hypothetical protein